MLRAAGRPLTISFSLLIGAFVPKAPDTLKPIGVAIIQSWAPTRWGPVFMWHRSPSGAATPKIYFCCLVPGGAGPCGAFPPDPPIAPLISFAN